MRYPKVAITLFCKQEYSAVTYKVNSAHNDIAVHAESYYIKRQLLSYCEPVDIGVSTIIILVTTH